MRALIHIPARAGSKGVPGKNLRAVGGLSLVTWAVRQGQAFLRTARLEGEVLVDTDGPDIAAEAARAGAPVPFLRAPELATDAATTIDATLAALQRLEQLGRTFDIVVLLQPTSPLRVTADLQACFDAQRATGSALTVATPPHPPQRALALDSSGVLRPVWPGDTAQLPRQQLDPVVEPNGAVYVSRVDFLRQHRAFFVAGLTRGVLMPLERSVDIDAELDFTTCETFLRARPLPTVEIAGRKIGPGQPCFVIAEAGVNHNGDVSLAHKLVDVAADAGADAVKFQTFDPKKLASSAATMAEYQQRNTGKNESQAAMLERLVLPRDAHEALMRHAAERGILFLSTPFDEGSADFLNAMGLPAFKIPSGELTNHPFIAHVARMGRTMLVSSGMANQLEVAQALDVIAQNSNPPVALFHCVTSYPAAPADTNLRAINTMRAGFGVPVGLSDHSAGDTIMLAAVARGAQLVEKHFTLDRTMEGPDHKASLEPAELKAMIQGIRTIEAALGDGVKAPRPAELPLIPIVRKSLHSTRRLEAGAVLKRDDVIALRPGTGLAPHRLETLIGRTLSKPIGSFEPLTEAHFDA